MEWKPFKRVVWPIQPNTSYSSIAIRELVESLDPAPPEEVLNAARQLKYRDFLTVALVIRRDGLFPDNWIYIHEPSVKMGRQDGTYSKLRQLEPGDGRRPQDELSRP